MKRYLPYIVLSFIITISRTSFGYAPAVPALRTLEKIQVAASVPQNQYELLSQDITALKAFQFSDPDPEMLSMMGIGNASTQTLLNWLQDRVHYLVSEDFQLSQQTISIAQETYAYPNPGILPVIETPHVVPSGAISETAGGTTSAVRTMMLNVGGAIYIAGKRSGALLDVSLDGIGKVAVTSPRIGVVKVGSGLFFQGDPAMQGLPLTSKAYLGLRMAALFHEAHHSDGNGTSLGFLHAICPVGNVYAGLSACDRSLNGPYEVQARFINSMARSCKDCTSPELAVLDTLEIDAASRLIENSSEWDSAPEGSFTPPSQASE